MPKKRKGGDHVKLMVKFNKILGKSYSTLVFLLFRRERPKQTERGKTLSRS